MPTLPRLGRRRGPEQVLQQRSGPVQLILAGLLIALIVAVEALLLRAYTDISETNQVFTSSSYLSGNMIGTQRETLLLIAEVERVPETRDFTPVELRRALLDNQLHLLKAQGAGDPVVAATAKAYIDGLVQVDRLLARARPGPASPAGRAALAAAAGRLRDLERQLKHAYDHEEQAVYGAIGNALRTRVTSERLLVGLSGLVLLVGVSLAFSLRRRVRADFARAWHTLHAEVEERKSAEAALRASEERFRSLVQNSSDLVAVLDADGTVRWLSESARRLLGVEPTELIGRSLVSLVHPDDRDAAARFVADALPSHGVTTSAASWRLRHREGHWLACETIATNLLADPNVGGLVLNMRDVTERKQLEAQLAYQAFHDALTGLANRTLFTERVGQAIGRAREGTGAPPAVLFIDLDDFKTVNDTLGHAAGDQLLVTVAERLTGCLRATDTAARFGGDEFAILLESSDEQRATTVARRVLDTLLQPCRLRGKDVLVQGSVGIALGDRWRSDAGELLRDADAAMYLAKSAGKGRYQLFEPRMHAEMLAQLELESELRQAPERGELVLYYQPTVELASGRVTGLEALVRWQHPTKGLLQPSAFIPLAEERGIIGSIGAWVLREACRQARRWQDEFTGREPLAVHVNLSGEQFGQPDLVDQIAAVLREAGLDPGLLTLEMTETVLLEDSQATIVRLQELKALGIRLAIDDFGIGYSSLSYLRRFPVDVVKIDKAFIDGVAKGVEAAALAQAVIRLCHTLHLQATAEGVEHPEQAAALLALGCHEAQGFHFAPPVPAAQVSELLRGSLAPVAQARR